MTILAKTLITSLALAGIAAICLGSSAHAQPTASPASAARADIPFQREDLVDPARLAHLQDQIEAAATRVCREDLQGDPLRLLMLRACIRDATRRAMETLEHHQGNAQTLARSETRNQR
ncbi:UrcA family protein [Maricaulis maris]|uniref:UrcA family protein n=1 Tax=Maricaulis maris TaxID=74318 RepID=UPI003B8B3735